MSALDRAFIKAFAKDATRDRAAVGEPGAKTRRADAPATAVAPIRGASAPEESGVATIAISRQRQAATARASVATAASARPMTESDRRAFEKSTGGDLIAIENDVPAVLPIAKPPPETISRKDAAGGLGVPSPHFAFADFGPRAATVDVAPVQIVAPGAMPVKGAFPAPLEMPAIPLPAARPHPAEEDEHGGEQTIELAAESIESPEEPAAEIDQAEPPADASAFTPVWEVDRFVWPAVCDKLIDDWSPALETVGISIGKLVEQSRRQPAEDRAAPIVAVASFGRGEGRTTTAACLARAAARSGLSTVLIDGDFENPQLASMLGLNSLAGWEDVMLASLPLEEAGVLSIEDRFTLLPALRARPAAELYGRRRIQKALASIAAQFELVVIDLGPIVEDDCGPYQSIQNCPFDAAVLVRDLRWTTESQLGEAIGRLEELETPILAVIENFAESRLPAVGPQPGRATGAAIRE
jgi:Mrp family chromosome partitioning ATPase